MKLKSAVKLKAYGKCNLLRKELCVEAIASPHYEYRLKDYLNEMFAGLSWLG